MENNKAIRAIILARVSSKEQEDGYSLEVQTERLRQYCERKGLEIIENFEIVESSTRGDRKQFNEIIKLIKSQREPVALVADKIDRVQRNQRETPILDDLIRKGKLELHLNSEGYVIHQFSNAHEIMMWGISVVVARSHTDLLSENVKKSFKRKIETYGEWIAPAPIGYLNQRDDKGKANVIIDPAAGHLMKKIFAEYATGAYTLSEMVTKAKKWGLRTKKGTHVSKSVLHHAVQNPFYYGEMRIKGDLWPHCYEPITTREIFKACEAVRMGWEKKPFQYRGKEFLFRGILTDAVTGKLVTADQKTRVNSKGEKLSWTYLRTSNPDNPERKIYAREDKILAQVENILKRLTIKDEKLLKKTMEYLKSINKGNSESISREVAAFKKEHTEIQQKLDKMVDLVTDGVLTREEFLRKKHQLKERQYELTELIKSYDVVDDKLSRKLIDIINITQNAHKVFKSSTISEKRELLNFLFANLKLNGHKLEYKLAFPFSELEKVANSPKWCRMSDSN